MNPVPQRRRKSNRAIFAAVLVALSLMGGACGSTPRAADTTSETPSDSAKHAGDEAQPDGACPEPAHATGECEGFDPDRAAGANEEYRQRHELAAENFERSEAQRTRIEAILREAIGRGPLSGEDVIRILRDAGYQGADAHGHSEDGGGIAFGVDLDTGCVFGQVRGQTVTSESGGATADAACLPPRGH